MTNANSNSSSFVGEREISNDAYKIFLVKRYDIQKNEALGRFICCEKLFATIDDALLFASAEDKRALAREAEEERIDKALNEVAKTAKKQMSFITRFRNLKHDFHSPPLQITAWVGGIMLLLTLLLAIFVFVAEPKMKLAASEDGGDYSVRRTALLRDGWKPYVRPDELSNWTKKYPENQFCYEDSCLAEFFHESDPDKIKAVRYVICNSERYFQCPGKPNGFERIDKEEIATKGQSDENFSGLKKKIGDNEKQLEVSKQIQSITHSHGSYKGEVVSGKANGEGLYTAAKSGTTYSGSFANDKFNGSGTMTWADGAQFVGTWNSDVGVEGSMTYPDGRIAHGTVRNAKFIAGEDFELGDAQQQSADAGGPQPSNEKQFNATSSLTDNDWYVLGGVILNCSIKPEGPAETVKTLQFFKKPVKFFDEKKERGVIVSVKLEFFEGHLYFVRGEKRCKDILNNLNKSKANEVNDYSKRFK